MPQLLKPGPPRARAQQQEKPPQWEACTLQLEKSPWSNEDPAQPKNKLINEKCIYKRTHTHTHTHTPKGLANHEGMLWEELLH